jgi:hypothetical protein
MKVASLTVAFVFALAVLPVRADSIDEAEAKRRGIPVTQLQAENALAKEKQKTVDLEKQIADLQKQIAQLRDAPATSLAAASAPAAPSDSAQPSNVHGSAEPSPLYVDFVRRYLAGDWNTLAADLVAKQKEIAALPEGNRADLTYIKQALAECRPAWWDQVKRGKPLQFTQAVWGQPVKISFTPAETAAFQGVSAVNGGNINRVAWSPSDMDAVGAVPVEYSELIMEGPTNITRGDGLDYTIWRILATAQFIQKNDTGKKLPEPENSQYLRAQGFWQAVTASYYCTPAARRLALMRGAQFLHKDASDEPNSIAQRTLGAAFNIELKTHFADYRTLLKLHSVFQVITTDDNAEFYCCYNNYYRFIQDTSFSLAEDRRIREFVKQLAEANSIWTNPEILLPGKQVMELDRDKDQALQIQRIHYLRSNIDPAPKMP